MRKLELMSADSAAFRRVQDHHRRHPSWQVALALALGGVVSSRAQEYFQAGLPVSFQGDRFSNREMTGSPHDDFASLQNNMPYIPRSSGVSRGDHNFRYGNLSGSMVAVVDARYTDNVILSGTDREADVSLTPSLGVGLIYSPAKSSQIRLDLGIGYNYYVNHTELSFINASLTPNTVLDYRLLIGSVMIVAYDRFTAPNDNRTRPEVASSSAGSTALASSQQIDNTIGTTASWAINEDVVLIGGYGYRLTRNFSDEFSSQDRGEHLMNMAMEKRFGPIWSAGAYANYSITEYVIPVQNDATGWSIGPIVSFRPYKNITFSASVGYSVTSFAAGNSPTSIQDVSSFSGLTYEVSLDHQFSQRMRHNLSISKSSSLGFGSNFTESQGITYAIIAPEVIRRLGFSGGVSWVSYSQSAPVTGYTFKDSGDTLRFYLGADYPLTRHIRSGFGLSHNRRASQIEQGNYNETAANVSVSYRF